MEYIYKLNLPLIQDILLPGKYKEMFADTTKEHIISDIDPRTYLRPAHRVFNNYEWDSSLLFYKADSLAGVIHTDTDTTWAINYIVSGIGEMRYYDPIKLGPPRIVIDPIGNKRPVYDNLLVPHIKKYMMPEGIYLVRTDMPHFPIGHGKRYCLSIRATDEQKNQSWDTVVKRFKQYII